MCTKDFEGFRNLFHRFLQVKGPSVEWANIQQPPEDSVSVVNVCVLILTRCYSEYTVSDIIPLIYLVMCRYVDHEDVDGYMKYT